MQFNLELKIFPTSRAIREFLKSEDSNRLLPTFLTIDDFFKKSLEIKNRKYIDEEQRLLYLKEAINVDNFEDLGMSKDFSSFINQSDYIFRFFQEISSEKLTIDQISSVDTYEYYDAHLKILKRIYNNYLKILDDNLCVDKINLASLYTVNESYIKKFDKIDLYFEGYFTKVEFDIVKSISKITNIYIHLNTNEYNQKSLECFENFELEEGFDFVLDFNNSKIIEKTKYEKKNKNINICAFNTRINQIAYIKKTITSLVENGMNASNIALVLPDETFATSLQLFDTEGYFNFAMGLNIYDSFLYKKTFAIFEYIKEPSNKTIENLNYLCLDIKEIDNKFSNKWNDLISIETFEEVILFLKENENNLEIIEKYDEMSFKLYKLLFTYDEKLHFKDVYKILFQKIASITCDDINSGKVTVLGLLETRAISFEALIIVDFNESFIPKRSVKDKFLSTQVKALAKLPTNIDRQNLQKYYYKRVIEKAKNVFISFVSNDSSGISRFAAELFDFKIDSKTKDEEYKNILYNTHKINHFKDEVVLNIDLSTLSWSSTSLKTYLDCKRKFYLKYIAHIKDHDISIKPKGYELGQIIHSTLEEFYKEKNDISYKELIKVFNKYKSQNSFLTFELEVWREKLKDFIELELERFKYKRKVLDLEKEFTIFVDDIKITGVIDRIDELQDCYEVLDYKTSSSLKVDTLKTYAKSKDFQLEFYYLAALELYKHKDIKLYYYDLSKMKLLEEVVLDEKLELLYSYLDELHTKSVNFLKCEEKPTCLYCNYKTICDR